MTEIETAVGSAVKVTCSKDELTRALSLVGRAVSTRAAVQVLGGVLLRAADGRLELAATDMEVSLRLSVEAQVEGDGAVVAPGRLLVDLARLLPDSEVVLEHRSEQGVLEVTCGRCSRDASSTWATTRRAWLETIEAACQRVLASGGAERPTLGGEPVFSASDKARRSFGPGRSSPPSSSQEKK